MPKYLFNNRTGCKYLVKEDCKSKNIYASDSSNTWPGQSYNYQQSLQNGGVGMSNLNSIKITQKPYQNRDSAWMNEAWIADQLKTYGPGWVMLFVLGFGYNHKDNSSGNGSMNNPLNLCLNGKDKPNGYGHNICILGYNIPKDDNGEYNFKKAA